MRPRRSCVALLALAMLLPGLACRGNSAEPAAPAPTPTALSTAVRPAPTGVQTTTITLHQTDFNQFLRAELEQTGGTVADKDVVFADLTGDGQDEAVVPIASGGTLGVFQVYVLSPQGSAIKQILKFDPGTGKLVPAIDGGRLVITEPVYGPDDPNCCPSQLKKTTFRWDGSMLVPASTETVDNPDAHKR